MARIEEADGNFDKAIKNYKTAIEMMDPANRQQLPNLGNAYLRAIFLLYDQGEARESSKYYLWEESDELIDKFQRKMVRDFKLKLSSLDEKSLRSI